MTWSMLSKWQRKEHEKSIKGNRCPFTGSVARPKFEERMDKDWFREWEAI